MLLSHGLIDQVLHILKNKIIYIKLGLERIFLKKNIEREHGIKLEKMKMKNKKQPVFLVVLLIGEIGKCIYKKLIYYNLFFKIPKLYNSMINILSFFN
jgi:hypothetical protein